MKSEYCEFELIQEPGTTHRLRSALRDRLVRRVIEEAFLTVVNTHGEEALYLMRFEVDPSRICARLGLVFQAKTISSRIESMNHVLGLQLSERMSSNLESAYLLSFVSQARHDWLRGKILQRAEARRKRERANNLNKEDCLWLSMQK